MVVVKAASMTTLDVDKAEAEAVASKSRWASGMDVVKVARMAPVPKTRLSL